MKQSYKKILKASFLFSLTLFFLYLAFRGNDFGKLFEVLKNANYLYAIAGAFSGIIIGGYFRALRWRYLLDPLKKNIGINNLFSSMMIGYMLNSIIPRSGEVYRPVLLANKEKISRAAAFGTILAERVFDVLSMLVSFGVCLFFFKDKLSSTFSQYNLEAISLYASLAILVFVAILMVMIFNLEKTEVVIEKITKKILPEKIHLKIHGIFVKLLNGFIFMRYPKYYLPILAFSLLTWGSYVLSTYLTLYAFAINLTLMDANLVLTMITFAMTVPLPANSAGIYHLFAVATLVNIYGVDKEAAFGFATVSHLLGLLGLILLGTYFFLKENLSMKNVTSQSISKD
ncbi:MAG: flippase-like domain-containing protein [Ignavibacteria bacterium]|nr:flippase-like domain-containing protein [Ignavibacteria bacterium]